MNSNIEELIRDITRELETLQDYKNRVAFLERVLKQLVLTHNGELFIDPKLGLDAFHTKQILDISASGVRMKDNPFEYKY